jgi:chaperonin cofactor prefoldin
LGIGLVTRPSTRLTPIRVMYFSSSFVLYFYFTMSNGSVEDLVREIEGIDSRLGEMARIYLEVDKLPTQAEVAKQLGVTDRTVRNDLQKLKVSLEKKFQEKNQF